jgi:hypothetical protein
LTGSKCVETDANGKLISSTDDCGTGSGSPSVVSVPNLIFYSTISVLIDTNTLTVNMSSVTFNDGTTRSITSEPSVFNSSRVCNLQQSADWGTLGKSGLRKGYTLTNNTWYQYYAVKSTSNVTDYVVVADTVTPIGATNIASLNTYYGVGSWVHLSLIPYGNGSNTANEIPLFIQRGPLVSFTNMQTGVVTVPGVTVATVSGATSLTFTHAFGHSLAGQLPDNMQGSVNWGFSGTDNNSNLMLLDKPGSGYIVLIQPDLADRSLSYSAWFPGPGIRGGFFLFTDGGNRNFGLSVLAYFIDNLMTGKTYAIQ